MNSNFMWLQWAGLLNDPAFKDRPCTVETTQRGQLIVTPVSDNHAFLTFKIGSTLEKLLPDGIVQVETPLTTRHGTKSPDVTWCSKQVHAKRKGTIESPVAPEICVEVLSPANSEEEMQLKIQAYMEQGAQEVWICDTDGRMRYYKPEKIDRSELVPEFPEHFDI